MKITKAIMLQNLKNKFPKYFLDVYIFNRDEWLKNKQRIIKEVKNIFHESIIVRSSSYSEDTCAESNAGSFDTVLDVNPKNRNEVNNAVEKVFASYKNNAKNEQVFIQKMLQDTQFSGVIFTRNNVTGAPYYIINYTSTTDTTAVTSGKSKNLETLIFLKNYTYYIQNKYPHFFQLIQLIAKIETFLQNDALDIEFAFTKEGTPIILQVRPLIVKYNNIDDQKFLSNFEKQRQSFFNMDNSLYGMYPDAHPIEIIGEFPTCLSFDLFQYFITGVPVFRSRKDLGYNICIENNLMVNIMGRPFVDIINSFNSLIPEDLTQNTKKKILDYYIKKLQTNQNFHNKVEFDILITNWSPLIKSKYHFLNNKEQEEFQKALKKITRDAIFNASKWNKKLIKKANYINTILKQKTTYLNRAYLLLEFSRENLVENFIKLSRASFIVRTIWKDFIQLGIISEDEFNRFLASLTTITGKMEQDLFLVKKGCLSLDDFIKEYGHLREGTYDITKEAYFENPHKYLLPIIQNSKETTINKFSLNREKLQKMDSILKNNIGISVFQFIKYSKIIFEGREYGKFIYTKYLSYALNEIIDFGKINDITREHLSMIPLDILLKYRQVNKISFQEKIYLNNIRSTNENSYSINKAIMLPVLISDENNLLVFKKIDNEATFFGQGTVVGAPIMVKQNISNIQLEGRIVLIENADPGYDWVLNHNIKGIITMNGGENSHIAIRVVELEIPAIIGLGKEKFEKIIEKPSVTIDFNKKILL